MAELRQNTWELDEWYDQSVAGTTGGYRWGGSLYAWGTNANGVLGQSQSSPTKRSSPVQIPGVTWKYIAGSGPSGYINAIKSDGTLWAWGVNYTGVLGQNNANPTGTCSSPMQVGSDTNWKNVAKGGESHIAAIKTDGTLWVMGENDLGALGLNSNTDISSPTQVGTDTTWKFSSMSKRHALAIKTDGTLWSWGRGNSGGLGLNSNTERSSPTQIGTRTNWKTCASRTYGGAATNTSGQLYSWGYNTRGELGINSRTRYSSPIQVPGSWTCVDSGGDSMQSLMAIKTNGTLWAWGYASKGAIDNNLYGNNSDRSSPTQIGTETTWSTAENENGGFNMDHSDCSAVMKTDGTWWTWGANNYGQLGVNDYTGSPNYGVGSPRQLPGSWKIITTSAQTMWGIK